MTKKNDFRSQFRTSLRQKNGHLLQFVIINYASFQNANGKLQNTQNIHSRHISDDTEYCR